MSSNNIIANQWGANNTDPNCFEFIVDFEVLGDVNDDGVFNYVAHAGGEYVQFSSLFIQLEREAGPIDSLQISRHDNPAGTTRISVVSNAGIQPDRAARMQEIVLHRIDPDILADYPILDEAALKAYEAEQRIIRRNKPETSAPADPAMAEMHRVAEGALQITLPDIWKDGGDYTIMEVRPGEVDLVAEGACKACPSTEGTIMKMYEDIALAMASSNEALEPLKSLNIINADNFELVYLVRADGIYNPKGQRTRTFTRTTPSLTV